MKTKFIFLTVLILAITACKNESRPKESVNSASESHIVKSSLYLNEGEKWQANKETQEGMKNVQEILKNSSTETLEAYQTLGKNLSGQTDYIIKNCTMQGKSHEQLHVILIPILAQITILNESTNQNKSQAPEEELEVLTKEYFNYFKL